MGRSSGCESPEHGVAGSGSRGRAGNEPEGSINHEMVAAEWEGTVLAFIRPCFHIPFSCTQRDTIPACHSSGGRSESFISISSACITDQKDKEHGQMVRHFSISSSGYAVLQPLLMAQQLLTPRSSRQSMSSRSR